MTANGKYTDPVAMTVNISAIVTAYQRIDLTLRTLAKLRSCRPAPAEIIVHVDGNQWPCAQRIHAALPEVRVIVSAKNLGPGGARNKLLAAANCPWVASFDDDSYPLDRDYFSRAIAVMERYPAAAIVTGALFQPGESIAADQQTASWVADFCGGACIYRRREFLTTGGYVPVPVAYGMEEVDLALRLHAAGGKILRAPWLRVWHETDLEHHANPRVTAASIANQALLTYLRYPPSLWWIGLGQCCKRIFWLLRHGRRRGIITGLLMTPGHLCSHRHFRQPINAALVKSYLALRHTIDYA